VRKRFFGKPMNYLQWPPIPLLRRLPPIALLAGVMGTSGQSIGQSSSAASDRRGVSTFVGDDHSLAVAARNAGGDAGTAGRDPSDLPDSVEDLVLVAEQGRIETIARMAPACVCIYDRQQRGGGSGVLIDAQGYGLTNFHVVAAMLDTRRGFGGRSGGRLHDLEVLGIDPTGDVAMFRLIGEPGDAPFEFVALGDSDAARVGDGVLALGNPFVLSEDYSPTVTAGILTGTHRYQWGQGNALTYSDCLQTNAAINPGNSGGALLDEQGRLLGINGRISLAAGVRGRYNVGVGYAISINQVKRFLPALRAGMLVRHGTLQATINRERVFNQLLEDGPAWKAGVRPGDQLLSFGGQEIRSDNHFASVLGTYPENWPVPLRFARAGQVVNTGVRLEPLPIRSAPPFDVDPEVSSRAAARAVERFRGAIGASSSARAGEWRCVTRRTNLDGSGGQEQRWARTFSRGQASVHEQFDGRANAVRRLVCDGQNAWLVEGEQRYEPPLNDRLEVLVLHALSCDLVGGWGITGAGWSAVGGDALLRVDDAGVAVEAGVLEVLEAKPTAGVTLRFGFEVETGLLRRAVARDEPSGTELSMTFKDDQQHAGRRWPAGFDVNTGSLHYREQWETCDAVR